MPLSKTKIKFIRSLSSSKNRLESNYFTAEGIKTVKELLDEKLECKYLYTTEDNLFDKVKSTRINTIELKKISGLKNPQEAVAVFEIPRKVPLEQSGIVVAIDRINNPGNLGTIIRICDWFGVSQIICSKESVDCYNPKVVQASMGSISRVRVHYENLNNFLKNTQLPIFAATLDGEKLPTSRKLENAIILLGNEANGISKPLLKYAHKMITIPRYNSKLTKPESINIAVSTGIILYHFKTVA